MCKRTPKLTGALSRFRLLCSLIHLYTAFSMRKRMPKSTSLFSSFAVFMLELPEGHWQLNSCHRNSTPPLPPQNTPPSSFPPFSTTTTNTLASSYCIIYVYLCKYVISHYWFVYCHFFAVQTSPNQSCNRKRPTKTGPYQFGPVFLTIWDWKDWSRSKALGGQKTRPDWTSKH